MNFYADSSEWKYLMRHALDWDSIIPLYYPTFPTPEGFNNKEELLGFFEELLTQTGDWTANAVKNRAKILDHEGPGKIENFCMIPNEHLEAFYNEAKSLEFFGLSMDPRYGGLGVPVSISMLAIEQIGRACPSSFTQIGFFTSIADMIERFCTDDIKEKYIPMILKAEISGSMCLTEPGAGSDLGSLRTSAEKTTDGTYLLNGSKIFITNAGGGLALVLAKIKGAPEGLDGISLFFAKEWLEDEQGNKIKNYKIVKNEDKMGLHGSFTCEVLYENTKATLVGEEHKGLALMFHLMNEARVAVGLQSLGGIEACLSAVRKYAGEREQFGKQLLDLPLYKRNLESWETQRDAFRALMVDTVSHFDISQKLDLKKRHHGELTKEETILYKKSMKVIRRRTPLVKFYGSELFTNLSTKAIQALGGYGFMREYDVERLHRDSFAPLLYEGTSQIQSLMALKDLIKYIMKKPSSFFLSTLGNSPFVSLTGDASEYQKSFMKTQFEFKRNLIGLLIHCLKPSSIDKIFKLESWQDPKGIDELMSYAESITWALSYIETLRVLAQHASKDEARGELFRRYDRLVAPQFAAIFTEWKL